MTSSKLYRNRKQNFQVLKPNVNCVTLAAGFSTPQVYNVNWVVPPASYIPQKGWGHVPPSSYGGAALVLGDHCALPLNSTVSRCANGTNSPCMVRKMLRHNCSSSQSSSACGGSGHGGSSVLRRSSVGLRTSFCFVEARCCRQASLSVRADRWRTDGRRYQPGRGSGVLPLRAWLLSVVLPRPCVIVEDQGQADELPVWPCRQPPQRLASKHPID